tara:strand:- start:1076 stop:2221 length:1146 start_codon:yes stop_codon:yes gene_type:complete
MSKIKVFCFTGTRADYPRIRPVLEQIIKKKKKFSLGLVVTGQHLLKSRGNSVKLIEADPFKIIAKIEMFKENKDSFEENTLAFSRCVNNLTKFLIKNRPDVALVTVDRVETLAIATVCRLLSIPICHVQGGEISGTQDEVFRHSITKLSDTHCVATSLSKQRLLSMGEKKSNIFVTGCPYIEYIEGNLPKSTLIKKNETYYLVCIHANTSKVAEQIYLKKFLNILLKKMKDVKIFFIMPNTDPGYKKILQLFLKADNWKVINNLAHQEYLSLLKNAACLIGNTSSGIREAPSYGVPFLNFGYRQDQRERGDNVVDLGLNENNFQKWLNPEKIAKFKSKLSKQNPYKKRGASLSIVNCLEFTYINKFKLSDKKFVHNDIKWK